MGEADRALDRAAGILADLGATVHGTTDPQFVLDTMVEVAVRAVAGAGSATVTSYDGHFSTAAATDEAARLVDAAQYELGSGPCVSAITDGAPVHLADARADRRWPNGVRRAATEHGFASVLSIRLPDVESIALNLYSATAHAFDAEAVRLTQLLARYAGMAVIAARGAARAVNLERALRSNHEIGAAIGVLMALHSLGHEQARTLLRTTSQHLNRRVADLATDVLRTGDLPRPGRPGSRPGRADRSPSDSR